MVKKISSGSPFEKTLGYSRAIVDGDMIYVSGTTGYDYSTMTMPEDVAEQARNALNTMAKVLEEAGSGLNDTLRIRYYLGDASYMMQIAPVLEEMLGAIQPAATMVIAQMIEPEMKVEIELTARKGAQNQ